MGNSLASILEKITQLRILVIGDIMLDHYIWGDANRISPEAPVPVVHVDRDSYAAGGAANVALNLASLGAQVELCGTAGCDASAEQLRAILEPAGVVFDSRWQTEGVPTIVKTRVVVRNQQLCRLDRESAPAAYARLNLLDDGWLSQKLHSVDAVILSDYAKGVISAENLATVSRLCREQGRLLSLDPKPKRKLAFEGVDLMTPNLLESLELAGIPHNSHEPFPAEAVCQAIWERHHPKELVITLGADGMLLSCEGQVGKHMPTRAREVFDVSGAGDTVIAALTAARATGASLEDAADFANHAAGVVVAKLGTATVTPAEILSQFKA